MATTSTSNSIRSQVANIIATSKAKGNPAVSQIKSLPAKERYSRLLGAAAAWHRASTNPSYKMSDAQKKDCAAAAMIIAEKRGIQPTNDGKYTQEQVKEFLDPKEMLTNLASYYIYDSKQEGIKETDTRQAIKQDIEAAYDNDQTAAQPTVAIAQAAPAIPKLSKDAVLSMGDDEYKEYSLNMDPADKAEMDEARKDQKDPLGNEPSENEIVNYKGLRDDPDWGHKKDDDDFKIEQGDIIEYLMKDVILASAAWAGNKVAGFAGTVSFELLNAGVKEIQPYGRKAKDKIAEGWDRFKRGLFGDGSDNDNPPPPSDNNNPPPENILNAAIERYETNIGVFNKNIDAQKTILNDPNSGLSKWFQLNRRLVKHFAVLGDNGITFDDGTTTPYQEFCGNGHTPESLKKALKKQQEDYDAEKIKLMIKELGFENNPQKQKEVEDWYRKQSQNTEKAVKEKNQNVALLKEPKEFAVAYANASNSFDKIVEFYPHIRKMEAQGELFSAHYGMHKYLEEIHKNPQGKIATDSQEALKFLAEQEAEAKTLFYTVEKARREGKTELNGHPIPSREEMVAEAEKLVEKSKQSNEPVEDTRLKPLYTRPANKNEEQSLYDAASKGDLSDQYAAEMLNLDNLAAVQQGNKDEIDKRRNQLTAFKERIFKETKAKDGKGVDIGKKYQDIKRQQGGASK